jgi:hypothetical protein
MNFITLKMTLFANKNDMNIILPDVPIMNSAKVG